jgi:hypothetical protein
VYAASQLHYDGLPGRKHLLGDDNTHTLLYTCLQEWAQRALVAYVRSVFLAPAKQVFKVDTLPLEAIAASWGLAAAPRMRFLRRVSPSSDCCEHAAGA